MKVISCYKAAQIAQVSKQLLTKYKKVNADDKTKYPYFSYDKDTGEFGVDIKSKSWLEYMEKRRNSIGYDPEKERVLTKQTEVKSGKVDQILHFFTSALIGIPGVLVLIFIFRIIWTIVNTTLY